MFITSVSFLCSFLTLADRLGATSFALGSGSFELGCETGASTKNLDIGEAFAAGWEIGTTTMMFSPCVWKIGAAASFAVVWDLGTGAFLAGSWWIEAATSLASVQDLGARAFLVGAWRIGAATSLAGSLNGTEASVAWCVVGAEVPSSLVTGMGVPDKVTTEDLSI